MQHAESSSGRAEFLGVEFDLLDFEEALGWLKARRSDDPFSYVVTPNVDHLVRLDKNRHALAPLYEAAALRLCDSRILAGLARMVGLNLPVVPGSDIVAALFASVVCAGDVVTIIGSSDLAIAKLRMLYGDLDIQHIAAPMGLRTNAVARKEVVEAAFQYPARFTLIAIGSPQQEMLALELLESDKIGGTALCIGASVDFLVGDQRRAPGFVQRIGMEWAWRLASDPPRLWRRYVVEGPTIFWMFWGWWRRYAK